MITSNHGRTISIRETTPDDASVLQQAYSNQTFIRLYRSNHILQSEEKLHKILVERAKYSPEEQSYIEFLIVHYQHGPIGIAALADYSELHHRAEYLIGIFDEKHRCGQNALEASLLTFDLAFNVYNINKLYTYVYEYNDFAEKNTVNLGFTKEGMLKNHHYLIHDKRFVSLNMNGLVVDDFRKSKRLCRLSLKVLGRNITHPYKEVKAIPMKNELMTKQTVAELTKKMRTM